MRPNITSQNAAMIRRFVLAQEDGGRAAALQEASLVETLPPPKTLHEIANDYNAKNGRGKIDTKAVEPDPRRAEIGMAYRKMKHQPDHPKVQASYAALQHETKQQWHHLQKHGYTMTLGSATEEPYKDHHEMLHDIQVNRHIKVFTGGMPPHDHPMSQIDPETGHSHNHIFRAVHDIMGHGISGHDFTEHGEENAFRHHAQMYSDKAMPALTTETRGQTTSYFNNRHKLGKFPPQKAGILPSKFHSRIDESVEWWSEFELNEDATVLAFTGKRTTDNSYVHRGQESEEHENGCKDGRCEGSAYKCHKRFSSPNSNVHDCSVKHFCGKTKLDLFLRSKHDDMDEALFEATEDIGTGERGKKVVLKHHDNRPVSKKYAGKTQHVLTGGASEVTNGQHTILFSYSTPVAHIDHRAGKAYRTSQNWSKTTNRHIDAFINHHGFDSHDTNKPEKVPQTELYKKVRTRQRHSGGQHEVSVGDDHVLFHRGKAVAHIDKQKNLHVHKEAKEHHITAAHQWWLKKIGGKAVKAAFRRDKDDQHFHDVVMKNF